MPLPLPTHAEIEQDLLHNAKYAAFFAPYHPEAVARFAQRYALVKHDWLYWGAKAEVNQTVALTQFSELAYSRLWDIQRKKLFDLQCRWRAGQVEVPGVECTFDFEMLDATIENCPVLPPITPDELTMYRDFVRQAGDFEDEVLDLWYEQHNLSREWQDYAGLRLHEEEVEQQVPDHLCHGEAPPAWYEFHNTRTGNGHLLRLPDLRGPRERPYLDAYYAARRAEHEARPMPAPPADPRPTTLPYAEEQALMLEFLRQFESPRLRRQQAAYAAQQAREQANEQVQADYEFLRDLELDEPVAVPATADWRAALRLAVMETKRHQLLAHLSQVYDEYCLRQSQGIGHPEAQEPAWRSTHAKYMREALVEGRERLGEPRDFNF